MRRFQQLPPLSLYVHLPWCIKKCPYCDFNSHEQKKPIPEAQYVDCLLADLTDELPDIWGRPIQSVFIGGGTPSLFSAESIHALLSGIRALTNLSPTAEITLEANPGTFEQERFQAYHECGVNRLSIGIQSFNQDALHRLGRIHSATESLKAVEIAKSAGFKRINLDLMFGLPEQTLEQAMADLEQALELSCTHLSFYELTLEPNTLFARFPPKRPSEDLRAIMQENITCRLNQAGFERYEISAYAKRSQENASHDKPSPYRSQHNMNYWLFGDYVGIGAGAHGKISRADTGNIIRRWKQKHPTTYLNAKARDQRVGGEQVVALEETALEFLMNALRLSDGFPLKLFEQHTGVTHSLWHDQLLSAIEKGLLVTEGGQLKTTPDGLNWLNSVLELFLPDENSNHLLQKKLSLGTHSEKTIIPIVAEPFDR